MTAFLAAIGVNSLLVLAFGWMGQIELIWVASALVLGALVFHVSRVYLRCKADDRKELSAAWRSPWPWLIGAILLAQALLYPPTMSDSICYRLPRMFLALQEGGITRFETADARMNGMPWGWEMMALPLASLNLLNGSKIINLICFGWVYQILFSILRQGNTPVSRSRWLALAFACTPAFLLQATSTANDLCAFTVLLAGVWMIMRFENAPGPIPVMASLLALVIAANMKPQFLTIGLPWLLWWALAPGKPWKRVPIWVLALTAPVYFFISPLPLLIGNLMTSGNLIGNEGERMVGEEASAMIMMIAGSIQFLSAQFQLPVFPGAGAFSSFLQGLPGMAPLQAAVPKLAPGVQLLTIVDGASMGLVHFLLILAGIVLLARSRTRKIWPWAAAFLFGVLLSSSQVVPSTIGRSFIGFFALIVPIATVGFARLNLGKSLTIICGIPILTGLAAAIVNPSAPLWPSHWAEKIAKEKGPSGLHGKLVNYNLYQQRAYTGADLLEDVPEGKTVGILLRRITPVSPLWQPDWRRNRINYVNQIEPGEFLESDTEWLVIGEKAADFQPEAVEAYSSLQGWELVREQSYRPNLKQGPEKWSLYRKVGE